MTPPLYLVVNRHMVWRLFVLSLALTSRTIGEVGGEDAESLYTSLNEGTDISAFIEDSIKFEPFPGEIAFEVLNRRCQMMQMNPTSWQQLLTEVDLKLDPSTRRKNASRILSNFTTR